MWILAQSSNIEAVGAAFTAIVVFMIPIIAILTSHQRKMAELIHGGRDVGPSVSEERLASLERQVAELSDLVRCQTLALDDLRPLSAPPSSEAEVRARVGPAD